VFLGEMVSEVNEEGTRAAPESLPSVCSLEPMALPVTFILHVDESVEDVYLTIQIHGDRVNH
jgi:hypothetical protein